MRSLPTIGTMTATATRSRCRGSCPPPVRRPSACELITTVSRARSALRDRAIGLDRDRRRVDAACRARTRRRSGRRRRLRRSQRMPMSPVANTSRSLSPTRSTIAWKSSSAAIPCWMLLITASSALRCSVSFSSRCVSSNRRAFSSATPMLAATVREQADLGLAERVLALVVLERSAAQHAVAADDRHDDDRVRLVGARAAVEPRRAPAPRAC